MASKRDDPPSASSDDDETEDEQEQQNITQRTNEESSSASSSEEEEEEEDDDDEIEEEAVNSEKVIPEKPKIQNPKLKTVESSSEEESESESEDETTTHSIEIPKTLTSKSSSIYDSDPDMRSPTASDFAIKPSKKINDVETPEKTPTSKRPSSQSDVKDKKKIKVSNGDLDDEKKCVVKRVWSDDDELLLLQGFIDYQSKKGCSPLSDMDGFYHFTMDSLPGNYSKSQLYEKVRRLKKKFRVNSEKVSGDGEDPVFPKPHDRKLFEVSKKIWGVGGCESVNNAAAGGSNAKAKVRPSKTKPKSKVEEEKSKVKEEDEDDGIMAKVEDFETLYPYFNAGLNEASPSLKFPTGVVSLIKKNMSFIGEAKAKELDQKWEALFEEHSMLRRRMISLLGNLQP